MKELLLVAAFLCSSNMLSAYGDKKKDADSAYVPTSMACLQMASGGEAGLCMRSYFIFLTQLCNFQCNVDGEIVQKNCHVCSDNENIYPDCYDLICVQNDQEDNDVPSEGNTPTHSPPDDKEMTGTEKTIEYTVQADDVDSKKVGDGYLNT